MFCFQLDSLWQQTPQYTVPSTLSSQPQPQWQSVHQQSDTVPPQHSLWDLQAPPNNSTLANSSTTFSTLSSSTLPTFSSALPALSNSLNTLSNCLPIHSSAKQETPVTSVHEKGAQIDKKVDDRDKVKEDKDKKVGKEESAKDGKKKRESEEKQTKKDQEEKKKLEQRKLVCSKCFLFIFQ